MEDLPFWLGLAERVGGPVLELGCGTGRVLVRLAMAGHRAYGLDREWAWLAFLRKRLAQELDPGPPVFAAPRVFAADMSNFRLALRFSLILLPCNTLSTLAPQARRATLACVREHLLPGGLFAFAIPNPQVLRSLPRRGESQVEDEFQLPETGEPVQACSAWQRTRQEFLLQWHYDLLHPDGQVERLTIATRHSLAPVSAYERDLQAAGLPLVEVCGDYDGSPAGEDAPEWIGVARQSG